MPSLPDGVPAPLRGRTDARLRATLRGLVPVGVLLVAQYAALIALRPLLSAVAGGSILLSAGLLSLLPTVPAAIALAVSRRLDRRSYADYGVSRSREWATDLLGGFAVGAVAVAAAAGYLLVGGYARLVPTSPAADVDAAVLAAAVPGSLLYLAANVASEEVVFRGVVVRNFAEGLAARSVRPARAAVGSVVAGAVVFGVWHPVSPGASGGVDLVLTSAGMGLLFGVGYLLTGNLSFPMGVHAGGLLYVALTRQPLLGGYALPTPVELVPVTQGPAVTYGVLLSRLGSGFLLVLAWVALTRGGVSLDGGVLRRKRADDRDPRPTPTDD